MLAAMKSFFFPVIRNDFVPVRVRRRGISLVDIFEGSVCVAFLESMCFGSYRRSMNPPSRPGDTPPLTVFSPNQGFVAGPTVAS